MIFFFLSCFVCCIIALWWICTWSSRWFTSFLKNGKNKIDIDTQYRSQFQLTRRHWTVLIAICFVYFVIERRHWLHRTKNKKQNRKKFCLFNGRSQIKIWIFIDIDDDSSRKKYKKKNKTDKLPTSINLFTLYDHFFFFLFLFECKLFC